MLLSLREKRLTLRALRNALGIEHNSVSPPLMGVSHYCEGCRTCANDIAQPSGIVQTDLEIIKRAMEMTKQPVWTREALAYGFNARDADVAGFDKIYYNPAKACLFCRRRRGEPQAMAMAPDLDADGADGGDVIHESREALFEGLAGDGVPTTRSLINAFGNYGTVESALARDMPKTGKASSKDRDIVTRRVLGVSLLSCAEPMVEVDLTGVLWKANNNVHTRCVDCGRHCVAHSAHQTNDGMTCGKHIHVECYADYHRIWWAWNISRNEAERALRCPSKTLAVPCIICRTRIDTRLLRTHDMRGKMFLASMCKYHSDKCATLIPTGFKDARLPWVRCDFLIAAAQGMNKKMYVCVHVALLMTSTRLVVILHTVYDNIIRTQLSKVVLERLSESCVVGDRTAIE